MKISLLRLKNCLGVKDLEFKPGKITIIQGAGKQGKTSVLESIEKTLYNTGKRPKFVFGGADKAETYLAFDDGTEVRKSINQDGKVTSVKIEKDGMSPRSPETFLKGLVGEKQLNPVEFIGKSDKEQVDTILGIMPITVTAADIKEWVGDNIKVNTDQHGLKVCKDVEDYLFNFRTEVNRDLKATIADVDNIKMKIPPTYNVEEWRDISLTEKYEAIAAANKTNGNILRAKTAIDNLEGKTAVINSEINAKISKLEQEIEGLKQKAIEQAAEENAIADAAKKYIETNAVIDIAPLETALKTAEEMKAFVKIADELKQKQDILIHTELEAKNLTAKLEVIRSKPAELLAKSEMPITGLTVVDGNILINNLPIKNLCGTEKIELALEIAKATAKDLKVILVDGLEALSTEDMNTFIEKCKDDDFQYIITRVTSGALTIINEDGEIL